MAEAAQTLTVADVATPAIAGSETIVGTAANVGSFTITGFPATIAGTAQLFTVSAIDLLGKLDTHYTGVVFFSSSDRQSGLPASYTFTAADAGVHTFVATLFTSGSQTITTTDLTFGASGVQSGITVSPAAAASFSLTGPLSATAGVSNPVSVTARDAYGNLATSYSGKLKFSSNDVLAGLPAIYTFTASDAGIHTFAVSLNTANTKTKLTFITVADTTNVALQATLAGIDVVNGVATQVVITPPSGITLVHPQG